MTNGKTINERFAQLISLLKLSNNAFAKSLGKSSTTINYIVDGKNKPGFDVLEATLSQYPSINPVWLMKGKGDVFNAPEPEDSSKMEVTPKPENSSYLQEHLKTLEENFKRLAAQLESKDKQIDGLQRTVDSLLGRSFSMPASETGRVIPLHSVKKKEKVG